MTRIWPILVLLLLGGGWLAYRPFMFMLSDHAPPHRFIVTLDEPARAAKLTLGNSAGKETITMEGGPREFAGSRWIADASGLIRIDWPDGSFTECQVSYITNGESEPHWVSLEHRKCPEVGAHVQF